MRQLRVSLSERRNTWRTSRSNTKSDVIGMWKGGKCHWCSQLGAQVGWRGERGGTQGVGTTRRCCSRWTRGHRTAAHQVNNTGCNGWGGHAAEQSTTHGMTKHRKCTEDGRCVCIDDAELGLVSMYGQEECTGQGGRRGARIQPPHTLVTRGQAEQLRRKRTHHSVGQRAWAKHGRR